MSVRPTESKPASTGTRREQQARAPSAAARKAKYAADRAVERAAKRISRTHRELIKDLAK